MAKAELIEAIKLRLAEVAGKRSTLPEGDLLTVFQYVRSGLEEKFSGELVGDSDFTQSGEGNAKDAYKRLTDKNSERKIVMAIIDRGGMPNMTRQKLSRLQYEEAIGSILHDLQQSETS